MGPRHGVTASRGRWLGLARLARRGGAWGRILNLAGLGRACFAGARMGLAASDARGARGGTGTDVGLPACAGYFGRRADLGLSGPGVNTGGASSTGRAGGTRRVGRPGSSGPTCRTRSPRLGRSLRSASRLGPASGRPATGARRECPGPRRAERPGPRAERPRLDGARRSPGLGRRARGRCPGFSAPDDGRLGRAGRACGAITADCRSVMGSARREPGGVSAARLGMGPAALGRPRVGCATNRGAGRTRGAFVGRVIRYRG